MKVMDRDMERRIAELERQVASRPVVAVGADLPDDVWQLVDPGGTSVLPPSGAYGVRKLTDTLASIDDIPNLSSPGTLEEGVGVAQNQRTAALAIVVNDARSRIRRDLYRYEVFSAARFAIPITGSSPTTYASCIAPTVIRG